jgi:hypothetical protein
MNLADELRKLAELHQEGKLSDQEFADAKRRLIVENHAEPSATPMKESAASAGAAEIDEKKYQSSRWSSGNFFFPDTLTLASDGMLFRKGAMFGSSEEHINYRAVASFRIKNGIFLSNLCIETSGGSQPIFINGLWKSEAREIQDAIRAFQRNG